MPAQTSKKTLLSTRSIVLDTLDASSFYDVSLSGNGLAAVAHTNLAGINSQLRGDTLRALGSNNTLTGGAGNDLLISSGANNLLVAAAGSDTLVSGPDGTAFLVANAAQLNSSSISGGSGTDTLRLGSGIRATDNQFSRIRGVEVLSLGGGASVTLAGSARAAGISSVVTGAGGATVQGGAYAGSLTLEAGSAGRALLAGSATQGNLFRATGAALATSTMIGGAGRDTLAVTGGAVADAVFQRTRGVEVLSLGAGASVTLAGTARAAGISSVMTGAGGGTVQGGAYAGSLTLEAGSAGRALLAGSATQANLFRASAAALATSTLTGGVRNDTLSILAGGTNQLSDSLFANLSRLDTLLLPGGGGSSVTLGAGAQRAGFTSIIGSNDGVAIRQEPRQTRAMTLVGGEGADLFSFASTALAAANSIIGGDGSDTISVDTGTMADPFFRKVSGIEVLSLGSGSSATLGNAAPARGIRTVVAGGTNVTVQAGSMEAALTLDASAVPGRVFLSGSTGGSLFLLGDADALGSSTLRGGAGADTLSMKSAGSYTDSSFARMRGIEVMQFAGGGNSIVLGSSAGISGLSTLITGSAGGDTITQTAGGYYLDASGATSGVYFNIASPLLLAGTDFSPATTIVGGAGTDTLIIGPGDFTDTSFFSNISGVEAISFDGLSSGGAITLDGGLGGFSTIVGSTGDMTFTQTEGSFVIDGRAGDTNLFDLTEDGTLLIDDTILGGEGIDSLFLGEAAFEEDPFANVTSVEVVSLSGASSIILGDAASAAGVSSLYGGEEGDSTIQVDAGSYYLDGSLSSSNLFVLSQSSLFGENTIVGNNDEDTLALGDGLVRDVDFGNLFGVSILSLMGSDANYLQLGGNAADAGVSTVYGGEGEVTVDLLAGVYDFEAGDATGTFLINAADSAVMGASTFTGNGEGSTLAFSEGEISDDAFANVKDVGSILLEGSSTITLEDAAASAGIGSVIGGAGDTTFNQTAGSFVLDGSGGTSNLFALSSASLAGGNTIIGTGNEGADTLAITEEDSLDDDVFANMTGISLLSLTGSSNATLGSAAADAGIVELIVGDGDSSVLLDSGAPSILLDGEGSSSLFVGITDAALAAASTLYGGTGTDTVSFGAGNAIEDESFANVTGFEIVSVTGGSSVALGALAAAGGLDSIYGGAGINTISQTAENANALYIDGGAGNIRVELDNVYYLVNDTILGGSDTLGNTLSVNGTGNIFDSYFTNQERLQTVLLSGNKSIELGAEAAEAEVSRVIVEDGDNSFTVTAEGPLGVTLDASAGTGDNSFAFDSVDQLVTARIYGADGTDTLSLANEALIADTLFARADSIEVLQLFRASDVTLGTYADSTGIATVIGGSGGTTFTQDALSGNAYYLDGSADLENGNLFVMASAAQVGENTLIGGDGFDTLQMGEDIIDDESLTNTTRVEILQMTGSSSVELGSYADQSGLLTVVGGIGNNTFTHTSSSEASYYLNGADGSSNIFSVADAILASIDTFVGGVGNDTLVVGEDVIDDTAFSNHESIEVLQLTGSSEVTLSGGADNAGIATVVGGLGDNTITQTIQNAASLYLDGSDAASNLFIIGDATSFSQDTILGGIGLDIVQIGEDVIDDAAFSNHRDLDVVQLTGSSDITLGEKADFAGIATVIGGSGNSSFTQQSINYTSLYLDGSESTTNLFTLNDGGQLAANTLLGGDGSDTLQIATTETLLDTDFINTSSVEVLRLTGSSEVTLGEKADFAGIATVIGGTGSSTITHADKNYGALLLDGSNGSSNLFVINGDAELAVDTIIGGAGSDTLQLATGARYEDASLANLSLVEVLQLSGTSDVTLASAAALSGISAIYGGSGATSLDASAMTGSLVIDASAGSGASFLLAGSGADNITGGSGADTLQGWATTGNSASDTIYGGSGADRFVLGDASGNGYGAGDSKALISDFTGGTDYLQLRDYGSGASSYSVQANAGSGSTHQLFDTNGGGNVLLANINYSGTDATGDLLGSKAIFA
ncbi:MAG: hypothetical protein WAN16_02225 [Chthoniobacterales bacterium]